MSKMAKQARPLYCVPGLPNNDQGPSTASLRNRRLVSLLGWYQGKFSLDSETQRGLILQGVSERALEPQAATMKAFLSHSTADKSFVLDVFNRLGAAQAELDAVTFEKAILNVEAIQMALKASQIFVLFVSKNSVDSNFVSFESRAAMEALASGSLKKLLIVCIDDVSLARIPDFLKQLNIVTHISSPGATFRRITSSSD